MQCPRCNKQMKVTHTYKAGLSGKTQRLECKCGLTGTAVTVMFALDPRKGMGAKAVADRLRAEETPPSLAFAPPPPPVTAPAGARRKARPIQPAP